MARRARIGTGVVVVAMVTVFTAGAMGFPAGAARMAPTGSIPVPGTGLVVKDSQPDYSWDPACTSTVTSKCYEARAVTFPSERSGATLHATLYGPPGLELLDKVPAVVVIPPSGGAATQGSVSYLAKYLAADDGYIGLTVDPQGIGSSDMFGDPPCAAGSTGRANPSPCPNVPYQQMDNFFDAGQSAMDYLVSQADPWYDHIRPDWVGAAGHSEGARAAAYLQDPAFVGPGHAVAHAVVALDNLTTNYCGDAGTPSNEGPAGSTDVQNAAINGEPFCLFDPSNPAPPDSPSDDPRFQIHPTYPGLGLASDGPGGLGVNYPAADPVPDQTEGPASEKETAALTWYQDGVPTAEYVLAGVNHNQFSQSSTSNEILLHQIADYASAWFTLWLGNDSEALTTLTSCTIEGEQLTTFLSSSYRSSVWVPGASVTDLRQTCANS